MADVDRRALLLVGAGMAAACATSEVEQAPVTTAQEVERLVQDLEAGAVAWVNGALEETAAALYAQADDMVIAGPFGGEPLVGRAAWGGAQAAAVRQFAGGESKLEIVDWFAAGDLLVLVLIERGQVTFAGRSEPQPWVLRSTQVFRRADGGRWLRVHRHADPLIDRRPLEATAALARGA